MGNSLVTKLNNCGQFGRKALLQADVKAAAFMEDLGL